MFPIISKYPVWYKRLLRILLDKNWTLQENFPSGNSIEFSKQHD
jgi:hypothetical protein